MAMPTDSRTIPEVFTDALTQFVSLLRKEGQLARAEVSEKVSSATAGLAFVVGGAVLLIPALVILLQAAVTELVARSGAALARRPCRGCNVAYRPHLVLHRTSRLKPSNMVPARTINQFHQDAAAAKDQMREGHDLNRAA